MSTLISRTTVVEHARTDGRLVAPPKPNGPAAAAILAAGIGCFALGATVVLSEAIPPFKAALAINSRVGPLSGKTIVEVLVYIVAWIGLAYAWRGKSVAFGKVYAATLILLALGLVGTFPLVYEVFTAK